MVKKISHDEIMGRVGQGYYPLAREGGKSGLESLCEGFTRVGAGIEGKPQMAISRHGPASLAMEP
jgi:hypothetical protein